MPSARRLWDRFWEKVDTSGDCWEWTAGLTGDGYGKFRISTQGGHRGAHRVAHELLVGPIPTGLVVDHLCKNRKCVNPDHLELVTIPENCERSRLPRRERCERDHELTEDNTYVYPKSGRRNCRTCLALKARERRQKT